MRTAPISKRFPRSGRRKSHNSLGNHFGRNRSDGVRPNFLKFPSFPPGERFCGFWGWRHQQGREPMAQCGHATATTPSSRVWEREWAPKPRSYQLLKSPTLNPLGVFVLPQYDNAPSYRLCQAKALGAAEKDQTRSLGSGKSASQARTQRFMAGLAACNLSERYLPPGSDAKRVIPGRPAPQHYDGTNHGAGRVPT